MQRHPSTMQETFVRFDHVKFILPFKVKSTSVTTLSAASGTRHPSAIQIGTKSIAPSIYDTEPSDDVVTTSKLSSLDAPVKAMDSTSPAYVIPRTTSSDRNYSTIFASNYTLNILAPIKNTTMNDSTTTTESFTSNSTLTTSTMSANVSTSNATIGYASSTSTAKTDNLNSSFVPTFSSVATTDNGTNISMSSVENSVESTTAVKFNYSIANTTSETPINETKCAVKSKSDVDPCPAVCEKNVSFFSFLQT
jgi:hypothetical protein